MSASDETALRAITHQGELWLWPVQERQSKLIGAPDAGLIVGLCQGGAACLQHLMLRYMLARNELAPCEHVAFLDYAAERIYLRKVGGGYIHVHRLLQDYFAELWEREVGGAE